MMRTPPILCTALAMATGLALQAQRVAFVVPDESPSITLHLP
jgi:hypothetical protein